MNAGTKVTVRRCSLCTAKGARKATKALVECRVCGRKWASDELRRLNGVKPVCPELKDMPDAMTIGEFKAAIAK